MRKLREKGITLVALVVTIIIVLILSGITIASITGNNGLLVKAKHAVSLWQKASDEEKKELDDLEQFFGEKNNSDKIPIYKSDELLKVGTGEEIKINEKMYKLDKGKTYVLQNDIEYSGSYDKIGEQVKNKEIILEGNGRKIVVTTEEGIKEYYTEKSKYYIATNKQGYVLKGLELYYDGIENAGEDIHSNETNIWKDLSGKERDGALKNMSVDCWQENALNFDGVDDYVAIGEINFENITMESVIELSLDSSNAQDLISSEEAGGYCLRLFTDNKIYFHRYLNDGNVARVISAEINQSKGKYSLSGSYDLSSGTCKLRVNEESEQDIKQGTLKVPNNGTIMILGANPYWKTQAGVGNFTHGNNYSVRIYSRALDDDEQLVNYLNDKERYNL